MVLKNWLESFGHGYCVEVEDGGSGGGGVAQVEVEEDGIDMVETTATSTDESEDSGGDYDVVYPIHAEREAARQTEDPTDEATEEVVGEPETDEPSPSETEVSSQPAAEPIADFPPELLDTAGQLGFKYQDVMALGTPAALQTAVDKQMGLLRQAVNHAESLKPVQAENTEFTEMRAEIERMREDGGYSEEFLAIQERMLSQNEQLTNQQAQMAHDAAAQRREVEQYGESLKKQMEQQQVTAESKLLIQWFDKQLDALPESHRDTFGTGSTFEITPGSSEYEARDRLMKSVNRFQSDWQGWGYASDNDPRIFQDALQREVGDHTKTTTRNAVKKQMRENGKRVTQRPTHTESQPLDGRERALRNADSHPLFSR